ncbi:hypothetical protein pb186bvf_008848 [Paramecium bursaria]
MRSIIISLLILSIFGQVPKEFEFLTNNDYGKKILKEQQIVAKSAQNVVDLIINLNHFENELVQTTQKQMKDFQVSQSKLIEQKQTIKQRIFLAKYQIQNIAEELNVVTKEKEFSNICYESRKKLLQEENKYIPQMQAIRNDEIDKLQGLQKEIAQTNKIISAVSNAFLDIIHFLSKKPDLSEKIGFMANTQRNSDLTKFEELCTSIKEDINDILLENPYTMIISSLKPLLNPESANLIEQVPGILSKLSQALISSKLEMEQLSNEREELFSLEKSELKRDIDKRSVESEQIRSILERAIQSFDKLQTETQNLKNHLQTYQSELEMITEQMDKLSNEYKENFKQDMEHLEILRKIKVNLNSNKQQYTLFLKTYKQS